MIRFLAATALLITASLGLATPARADFTLSDNTHLIDQNLQTGFAIYRSSKPNRIEDFKRLCSFGVTEMMVLDGTGSVDASLARQYCPGLKVIYNQSQMAKVPLTVPFLKFFDQWVENARRTGTKIAFRCNCGCHRTGRLAAYYQLKYQGYTTEQALAVMFDLGKFMFLYPMLPAQVRALNDYVQGIECTQRKDACVQSP